MEDSDFYLRWLGAAKILSEVYWFFDFDVLHLVELFLSDKNGIEDDEEYAVARPVEEFVQEVVQG